jgi:methionyl-tRNA formyltransferase
MEMVREESLRSCCGNMRRTRYLKIAFMGGNQAGIIGALTILASKASISVAASYSEDLERLLKALGVKTCKSINSTFFKKMVKQSDLLICVHGREIVGKDILGFPRLAAINIHPYLYAYKGSDPVGRALRANNFKGSVGAHIMTAILDSGKVIKEDFLDLEAVSTVEEMYNKLYPLYSSVLLKVLRKYSQIKK